MIYKKTKGPRGRVNYFRDGKMVSVKSLPGEILAKLEEQAEVDDRLLHKPVEIPVRNCLFDGEVADKQRAVNGQTVDLCSSCYYDKSTGKIVARLREINEKKEILQEV